MFRWNDLIFLQTFEQMNQINWVSHFMDGTESGAEIKWWSLHEAGDSLSCATHDSINCKLNKEQSEACVDY